MSNPEVQVGVSRPAVDALLAKPRKASSLKAKLRSLRKVQEQIAHFCPWPALEGSFQADIDAIEAELQRRK